MKDFCPCDDCSCKLKRTCAINECECCGDIEYVHWDEQK